ncbi:hypothetical protein [Ktedonospora formicarum]|uniref:Uncharacterized protein n=1 Tax=Ktedonospora formicarum TaxID=2778364 RepID=A0A8J3MUZ9_9CHLR|nr:hypothetical protein [Ktedonospora formicarum]GHO47113.1 hypothetical protein KSX_52760 [Ktedonospora formicarum]
MLDHLLIWLGAYYWQAITTGQVSCRFCEGGARASICGPQDIPSQYTIRNVKESYGVMIVCSSCHRTETNTLSHCLFDLPQVQHFWHKHSRMRWYPVREVDYQGQPALLGRFQSVIDKAGIDVICQRETLEILQIQENQLNAQKPER